MLTAPIPDAPMLDVGRSHADALRSVKRYVAVALGEDWEVRLSREEGAFARPFARVWQVAGTTYPLTGGRWLADMTQPFVIAAYPQRGRDPDDALLKAQKVENMLYRAFRVGVENGRAMRVPLYNYYRVRNWDHGRWYPRNFMRVNDLSTQPFPDPDDDKLWTVVCDVRLTWRRVAETRPERPILRYIPMRRHPKEPPCKGLTGSTWPNKRQEAWGDVEIPEEPPPPYIVGDRRHESPSVEHR